MTPFQKSLSWTLFWFLLALVFNVGVYCFFGFEKAIEFAAGYLVEESLSIDNLFVFLLIFSYFNVSKPNQHKILFWGILGAIILRALFIFGGVFLVAKFHWLLYIFGALLLYTSVKMLLQGDKKVDLEKNFVLRCLRKVIPISTDYNGNSFWVRQSGKLFFTPLLLVLVVVEATDIVFAMDSLPAIFAITLDPFIIYTSNLFAICGLRSLYFVLAEMMGMFDYLKYGVAAILAFIGVKILLSGIFVIPIVATLLFIVLSIGAAILGSVIKRQIA